MIRHSARTLLSALAASALFLALAAAPAVALETHDLSTHFGEPGPGDGQLSLANKSGLAVNAENGDLYVADTENHRVVEFSKTGAFLRASGADVGGPGVNVCTSGCHAATSGHEPGQLAAPTLLAVDNDPSSPSFEDVYVADSVDNTVSKFDSTGHLIASWGKGGQLAAFTATATATLTEGSTTLSSLTSTTGTFLVGDSITAPGIPTETKITAVNPGSLEISNPATESATQEISARAPFGEAANGEGITGIAVDPAGHLWVYGEAPNGGFTGGEMYEFAPGSESLLAWSSNLGFPSRGGIAIDSSGNLYLPGEHFPRTVIQFTPAGVEVGPVDQPLAGVGQSGFALDTSTNDLYALDEGRLETEGLEETAFIDHYHASCDPGGECAAPADTFGFEQVSRLGTGLAADPASHTVYAADPATSRVVVFAGPVIAPEPITEAATVTGLQKATLTGHLDPGAGGTAVTSCAFQYVPQSVFQANSEHTPQAPYSVNLAYSDLTTGATVPCAGGPTFAAPASVHAGLTGLTAGTAYRYRLILTDEAGHRRLGETHSFTTPSDHAFASTFAGSGSNALSNPTALAVDERTHDVWVNDPANHRVEKFTPAGAFLLMIGLDVNEGRSGLAADLCTASEVCQPGLSTSTPGGFEQPSQLAVDNSSGPSAGDLYVADGGDALVSKFDSTGHLIASWGDHHGSHEAPKGQLDGSSDGNGNGPFGHERGFAGLAVDSAGDLWVAASAPQTGGEESRLFEFDPSGRWLQSSRTPSPGLAAAGLAVDSANRLYAGFVGEEGAVRLSSLGAREEQFETNRVTPTGLAVDSASAELYVDTGPHIAHFTPAYGGEPGDTFGSPQLDAATGLAIDSTDEDLFAANTGAGDVVLFTGFGPSVSTGPIESPGPGHTSATLTGTVDPIARGQIESCHFQYVTQAAYEKTEFFDLSSGSTGSCDQSTPITAETETPVTATIEGLTPETTYRYRLLAENSEKTASGQALSFTPPAVLDLKTEAATEVENESATLNGSFTADEEATEYFFEYGTSTHYGHQSPPTPAEVPSSASGPQHPEAQIEGLIPGTTYHYRLIARSHLGTTEGKDETFTTAQPPTVEGTSSSDVTATSAVLHAKLDPQVRPGDAEAECRFQYGTTTAYGQSAPCPEKLSGTASQAVEVHLEGLTSGATYHFRLIAQNKWGEATSEDQTFEFFPPACPNAAVRQQTSAAYLPDCRAYELLSPANANGTLLFSGGPATPQATSPSRFAYIGALGAPPEATDTTGTDGDLYLATRTDTGWVSHYIGLPGDQTGCIGGPPTNPGSHSNYPGGVQDSVLADPSLSRLLDFKDGTGIACAFGGNGTGDASYALDPPSNAPYLWNADGSLAAHLPSGLPSLPGAEASLACPTSGPQGEVPACAGEVTASPDLTHLIFSSNNYAFTAAGLTVAPGSAYDDNLETGEISLISKLGTGNIPQDPHYAALPPPDPESGNPTQGGKEEFLRFPAVSPDGSHVLISTATAYTDACPKSNEQLEVCPLFTDTPIHLYMHVGPGPGVTYEIAESQTTHEPAAVHYVGMTEDGSRVFFTSEEHLTPEDPGHGGASLYMWEAKKAEEGKESPLTLISKANLGSPAGAGDTESCEPTIVQHYDGHAIPTDISPWTIKCGIVPYSGRSYAAEAAGLAGGNGVSDIAIASKSGDVFFYSPEQLDGDLGVPGAENLYDYRAGRLHFVAAFEPGSHCEQIGSTREDGHPTCTEGPIARLQVNPDGSHVAFVTADRLTSYDNTGHQEMYSYTPATEAIVCDSCNPSGAPATAGVFASQNGLFQTEDGRTFFSTTESLVPRDTNQATDVYEFTGGRPHLITPGTGTATVGAAQELPGLIGVSANGTDVYFSTFDSLISEDHNGNFLKFYDARTDGGFPQPPPVQPCAAAEECHGPGTEAPALPTQGTAAPLAGGNVTPGSHKHHKKHHKRKGKIHNHRAAHHNRGGGK